MSRVIAIVMMCVPAVALLGAPGAFAQASKDKPAKTEAKLVDINTDGADELQKLNGIGDACATQSTGKG